MSSRRRRSAKIVRKLTDAMVSIGVENMRPVTWVIVEEVKSGDWGIGDKSQELAAFHSHAVCPRIFLRAIPAARPKGVDFPGDFVDEFRAGSYLHGG